MLKKLKTMVLMAVGILFLSLGQPACAEETGQGSVITPQAYQYMYDASCLSVPSGTSIGVSGTTRTYSKVDKITTTAHLEKKTSTGWSVVKSWTNSTSDSTYCNVTGSYTGEKGTTYRVRCYHRVDKGNLIETNTSYTNSFSVN